jgi:hypothetical protein
MMVSLRTIAKCLILRLIEFDPSNHVRNLFGASATLHGAFIAYLALLHGSWSNRDLVSSLNSL